MKKRKKKKQNLNSSGVKLTKRKISNLIIPPTHSSLFLSYSPSVFLFQAGAYQKNKETQTYDFLFLYHSKQRKFSCLLRDEELDSKIKFSVMWEYKNDLFIHGGIYYKWLRMKKAYSSYVIKYNLIKRKIDFLKPKNSPALARHKAVKMVNDVFLFGGEVKTNRFSNKVFKLNLKNSEWNEVDYKGEKPDKRIGHSMNKFKNSLVVFGGMNQNNERLNNVWIFDTIEENFSKLKLISDKVIPSRRSHHGSIIIDGGFVFVYGGINKNDNKLNDLYMLNISKRIWTKYNISVGGGLSIAPRLSNFCAGWFIDMPSNKVKMILFSGMNEKNVSTNELFEIDLDNVVDKKIISKKELTYTHKKFDIIEDEEDVSFCNYCGYFGDCLRKCGKCKKIYHCTKECRYYDNYYDIHKCKISKEEEMEEEGKFMENKKKERIIFVLSLFLMGIVIYIKFFLR